VVLIVEDDAVAAETILMALKRVSRREHVIILRDAVEALAYFMGSGQFADRDAFPLCRLVLLGVKLPGVNGLGLLAWLRTEPSLKVMPVVLMVRTGVLVDVADAYRMGANSVFVCNPVDAGCVRRIEAMARFWLCSCTLPPGNCEWTRMHAHGGGL
jgi:DNA-binding response OmpR family regulator